MRMRVRRVRAGVHIFDGALPQNKKMSEQVEKIISMK